MRCFGVCSAKSNFTSLYAPSFLYFGRVTRAAQSFSTESVDLGHSTAGGLLSPPDRPESATSGHSRQRWASWGNSGTLLVEDAQVHILKHIVAAIVYSVLGALVLGLVFYLH